jgi:Ni/Co efflux regulator RcnB
MTRHGRILSSALALSLLGGVANAQGRMNPPGGEQHGEQRGNGRGQDNRGGPPRQLEQGGPERGPDHRDGPKVYDQRGHYRGDQNEWRRGDRVDRQDWNSGGRIDYRERHLRQPPRGYEWREVNGALILGVIATGVIADILLNQH